MATVNYVRDIFPFDNSPNAFSNPVIADELNGQTLNEIPVQTARTVFGYDLWWYQASPGVYAGELQIILDNPVTPQDIKDTLNELWSLVFGGAGTSCQTTLLSRKGDAIKKQFAARLKAALDYSVTVSGSITQEELDAFYAIGGRKYTDADPVTGPNVQASRDAYNADNELANNKSLLNTEYTRQYNLEIAPIQQSSDPAEVTNQAYKDALVAMAANWVDV